MEEQHMSEAPVEQPNEPNEPQEQTQGDPADAPLGEGGEKALKAEREARKAAEKERDEFRRKVEEAERANESVIEKAQREAREAQESAAKAYPDAFRAAAIKFGGISEEDADLFLTGSDAETLAKQAARLVERTPTAPKPDPSQGGRGGASKGSTADQFAAAIESAFN